MVLDESTIKTGIGTKKSLYLEGEENTTEITAKSYSVNFLSVLGFNCESLLFDIKNLNEFEFGKSLFKIRNFYSTQKQDIELLNYIINNYNLSKKEIRKIIENNNENNEEFIDKILRSINLNKKDKSSILARKLGKHCKRESTENPEKIKQTKKEYIYKMIEDLKISSIFQNKPRIVLFLDNAPAHISDFTKNVAEALNIYLLYLPKYSPWFNPVEEVWDIHKNHIKGKLIESKVMLIEESHKIFNDKCRGDSLQKNFKEKYLTSIC